MIVHHFSNCIGSYSIHFSMKSLLLMEILGSGKEKLLFAQMFRVQANQFKKRWKCLAWDTPRTKPNCSFSWEKFFLPLVSEVFGESQHFQSPPSLQWASDVPALKRLNSMLTIPKIFLAVKYYHTGLLEEDSRSIVGVAYQFSWEFFWDSRFVRGHKYL